ncbi:MAG: PqqD family protein [Proteobacteria bacterium]|nr:PqqD family protein [Pseudomonadota bacterium]
MGSEKESLIDWSRDQAMEAVPEKNREVGQSLVAGGGLLLSYPVVWKPWFARAARRLGLPEERARTRKVQLDSMGAAVWAMVDGQRSVSAIVKSFAKEFSLHPAEAELAVTRFLLDLGKRGLIGVREGKTRKR